MSDLASKLLFLKEFKWFCEESAQTDVLKKYIAFELNSKQRGGLHPVVSHKSIFGNLETGQPELWNLAQWEVSSVVPGKVLWRKCIGGLGAKINQ